MFKDQVGSLIRYVLAGFTAWMAQVLTGYGFSLEDSEAFAAAVSGLISATILLFWSFKKNKDKVGERETLKKKVKIFEEKNP